MILLDTDHLSVVTDRRDKGHAELLVRLSRDHERRSAADSQQPRLLAGSGIAI
jgi:hypothetical protein